MSDEERTTTDDIDGPFDDESLTVVTKDSLEELYRKAELGKIIECAKAQKVLFAHFPLATSHPWVFGLKWAATPEEAHKEGCNQCQLAEAFSGWTEECQSKE